MPSTHRIANPFALMLDPQAVFASIEHSERLARLHSRICRPLDKPMLGQNPAAEAGGELASFDNDIDTANESSPEDGTP